VALESDRDISVAGSNIIATDDVSLKAGRDTVLPVTLTNISITNLGFVIGIWRIASIFYSGLEIGLRFDAHLVGRRCSLSSNSFSCTDSGKINTAYCFSGNFRIMHNDNLTIAIFLKKNN